MLVTFIQGGSNKLYTLVGVRLSKSSVILKVHVASNITKHIIGFNFFLSQLRLTLQYAVDSAILT